jgi:hypothetical protein
MATKRGQRWFTAGRRRRSPAPARRLEKLAMPVEVLTLLSERDATIASTEHRAGAAS